jgi:hypothetical protein
LPEDDEPLDDFEPEPDDLDEPPDLDPEADFLAEDPPERPFDVLLELLLDDPLFDDEDRELPLFAAEDDRVLPPLFDEDEPRFEEEPLFEAELRDDEPDDFLELPDEELFFEPDDELLLPEDLLLEERDEPDFAEPLLDDEPERPPLFDEDEPERPFPPLELLREDDEEPPLREPPRDAPVCVPAIADWTTVAAPSTAPIAAPATMLPAASAAFDSRPLFFRLPEDRFDELVLFDEPLFFDFVVAIFFPMFEIF